MELHLSIGMRCMPTGDSINDGRHTFMNVFRCNGFSVNGVGRMGVYAPVTKANILHT